MLLTNKILMDLKFKALCIKGDGSKMSVDSAGAIYKAAYNAYYDVEKKKIPTNEPSDNTFSSMLSDNGLTVSDIDKKLQEDAHIFASCFADAMDECLSVISDEIDEHIKSAAIDIIIPVLPPTIVNAGGPCTGSLIISEKSGAQIVIS